MAEALQLMRKKKLPQLVILDDEDRPIGMVSGEALMIGEEEEG